MFSTNGRLRCRMAKLPDRTRDLTRHPFRDIGLLSRLVRSSFRKVHELSIWTQTSEDALAEAAALREEALQMDRGEFCEGSGNGSWRKPLCYSRRVT